MTEHRETIGDRHHARSSHDSEHLTHPRYRTDIDGLRAIAVLAVVGFHAFPGWVRGGFIGVDVFFVISGFLISTIIFSSLLRNSFSFIEFYSRRIRRIFPALLLILVAAGALGWFALFADEYRQLGKHIAGGAAFIFNFLVWNESGYFDSSADKKPLLHLWSLGIEEQFYIFWPLILCISWKRHLNFLAVTLVIVGISFALNILTTNRDVTAAFYSPQTRFWELSIGSALAYGMLFHQRALTALNLRSANLQAFAGATLIVIGIAFITQQTAFPGWWAVLPTVGAALMISAGMRAWLNRVVLSNSVMVWIGLISFPLYLWHWPLLSFARIIEGRTPAPLVRLAAVVIAIVFAWLTYRLVEKPLRFGKQGHKKTIALLASMTAVGALGLACYLNDGLLDRIKIEPETAKVLFMRYPHEPFHNTECDRAFPMFKDFNACLLSKPAQPDVLIIGDSHSSHFYKSLAKRLNDHAVMNLAQWSCLPFSSQTHQSQDNCNEKFNSALDFVKNSTSIKTVYLAGYWAYLAAGGFGTEHDGWRLPRTITTDELKSFERNADQMLSALRSSRKQVVLILDVPDLTFSPRSCATVEGSFLIKYRAKGTSNSPNACFITRDSYESRVAEFDTALAQILSGFPEVKTFSPRSLFCDAAFCQAIKNNVLLYYSCDHLTIEGADMVVDDLVKKYPPIAN
jgi:peptidoglycan/LPS O-acetylase OafA/YrhL